MARVDCGAASTSRSPPALAADSQDQLASIVDRYSQVQGHKALAITDGPRTAWAFAASHRTSDDAVKKAVRLCQTRAAEAGITATCRVIAIDDRAVDSRVESQRLARAATRRNS